MKELRSQISSAKRNTKKKAKPKDSFINDETSSESGSESLYYTALTNPRKSTNSVKPKATVPPSRAIAICDSDSEDEDNVSNSNENRDIRGRKLLFSDDEDETSSTSEFDPGDDIPPKPTVRKGNIFRLH